MNSVALGAAMCLLLVAPALKSEPVAVKQKQGASRGFLIIRSEAGEMLATGELTQVAKTSSSSLVSRLTYRFRDGSIDDETSTFTQRGVFRLLRDHHIQKGPFFPKPADVEVDTTTGTVTSRSVDKDGKEKVETEHMDLPPDLSNGLVAVSLLNVPPNVAPFKISMLAASGKGRLVKLAIEPIGEQPFLAVGVPRKATVFRAHIEIGGVAGVVAPLVDKQPDDEMVWILEGAAPVFIRQVGQLYVGGPKVSVEMAGTTFPR